MVLGAVVGGLLVAGTIATGGLLGVALIAGGIAAGGLFAGQLANGIQHAMGLPDPTTGLLGMGSPNVTIGGKRAARAGIDFAAACNGLYGVNHFPLPAVLIAQGSDNVYINGHPAARVADKLACGAEITHGQHNVYIGGGTITVVRIWDSEALLKGFLQILGLAAFFVAGAALAWAAGAAALAAGLGWGAAIAEALGATVAYAAIAEISGAALGELHKWGDTLGPGWGDIVEGTGGLLMLFGGTTKAGSELFEGAFNRLNPANYEAQGLGSNLGNLEYKGPLGERVGDTEAPQGLPDWLKERFEAGNEFNRVNRPRYPYNEVEVVDSDGNLFRVDSYDPAKGEIVSRKFTQLGDVQPDTGIGYLQELARKYPEGATISDSPFNPRVLQGQSLTGDLILEVPPQNSPVPKEVLDYANENGMIIRDVNGKAY